MAGQVDAKLSAVLRNEQAMNQHLNETRALVRELEQHVLDLKHLVGMLNQRIDEHTRDINVMRARFLGGGPT